MELFGKMELNTYLCRAKKERDGLRHQRYITQTGYRTLPEFAKKETLRIIPQQFQARQHDTVQLTYPASLGAFYSCEQCASIMSIFSFGDKKLAALRLMAPRIIDPHRAYLIYDKLTFQSEKDEAARIIGGCGKHR